MDDAIEVHPPQEFADSNDRNNDPWDHDAVCWLLSHGDVQRDFTYHSLFECARRQNARIEKDLDNVLAAAVYCGKYGVRQIQVHDAKIGKSLWRLQRTDPEAPAYPAYEPIAKAFAPTPAQKAAAAELLPLLGDYEAELETSGKSENTVFTYVDRARRFLRRIVEG